MWGSGTGQHAGSLVAAWTLVSRSCVTIPGRTRSPAGTTPEGDAEADRLSAAGLDAGCCGWLRAGDDGHDGRVGSWSACAGIPGCGVAASARAASRFGVEGWRGPDA